MTIPLLSHLEFAQTGLAIRYRGSSTPQRLSIDIHTTAEAAYRCGDIAIRRVSDIVNFGAAGGAMFSPALGSARLIDEQPNVPGRGPVYHWDLEVAGVCPKAIRVFVEQLRYVGCLTESITTMSLLGALAADESEHSTHDGIVREWLASADAYPEEWPDPGFPIKAWEASVGATIRVTLAGEITPLAYKALRTCAVAWTNVVSEYVSESGQHVAATPSNTLPSFGVGRREFSAHYRQLPKKRGASRAALVNMMARYHRTVAPIAGLEIGI